MSFLLALTATAAAAEPVVRVAARAREHQPAIQWSGRVNAIARHPERPDEVIVSVPRGALFRSRDGGWRWAPIQTLPAVYLNDVAYHPEDRNLVVATARRDFRSFSVAGPDGPIETSGGGIWISRDGGGSWSRPLTAVPRASRRLADPNSCPPRYSAWGIDFDAEGTIYVGTDCGVASSNDKGRTWSHAAIPGLRQGRPVFAVAPLIGGPLLAGSRDAMFWSTDGGRNWTRDGSAATNITFFDALAASPTRNEVFVATRRDLYRVNLDAGGRATWTRLVALGGGSGCGGNVFVKARRGESTAPSAAPNSFYLVYGNRCSAYAAVVKVGAGGKVTYPTATSAWARLYHEHGDARNVALKLSTARDAGGRFRIADGGALAAGNSPGLETLVEMLANDGGLEVERTLLGLKADPVRPRRQVGSGPGKLNALQVTEVAGQTVVADRRHDLYFATQDNDIWSSNDDGRSWPISSRYQYEGFGFDLARRVQQEMDSEVTFTSCATCLTRIAGALLSNVKNWNDPFDDLRFDHGYPVLIDSQGSRVSLDKDASGDSEIERTTNGGTTWTPLASLGTAVRDSLKTARRSPGGTELFVAVNAPALSASFYNGDKLIRPRAVVNVSGVLPGAIARPTFPKMLHFGGLGRMPTEFAYYAVYAVDPDDPAHLLAPDVVEERMASSKSGGNRWTAERQLTDLVTLGGDLAFVDRDHDSGIYWPLVSAISFFPDDPDLVILGTRQGGAYVSGDRGASWRHVVGSSSMVDITSFHWISGSEILVGTYGRGLWKTDLKRWTEIDAIGLEAGVLPLACFSPASPWQCRFREYWGEPLPEPIPFTGLEDGFDGGWLLHDGFVTGARTDGERLTGVSLSPGATVIGLGGGDAVPQGLEVLEELLAAEAPDGFEEAPVLARVAVDERIVGLLTSGGDLFAIVTSDDALSRPPRPAVDSEPNVGGSSEPPLAGWAHIVVGEPTIFGLPMIGEEDDSLIIRLRNFAAEAPVEVEIDGDPFEVFASLDAGRETPGPFIFLEMAEDGERILRLPIANVANANAESLHRIVVRQRLESAVLEDVDHFAFRHCDGSE